MVVAAEAAILVAKHERRQREAAKKPQQDAYWAGLRAEDDLREQERGQYQAAEEQYYQDEWRHQNNPNTYSIPQRPVPPPFRPRNPLDYGGGN